MVPILKVITPYHWGQNINALDELLYVIRYTRIKICWYIWEYINKTGRYQLLLGTPWAGYKSLDITTSTCKRL